MNDHRLPPVFTTFAESDWMFDRVPDHELVACCYWEYARESNFIRDTLRQYRDWFHAGGLRSQDRFDSLKKIERIQSIGCVSEVLVRGCAFPPPDDVQNRHLEKANFRRPGAAPITGSFPAAWQSLSEAERNCRALIRSDRTQIPLVPFRRGAWPDAQDLAKCAERHWNELRAAAAQARRENPDPSEADLIRQCKVNAPQGIHPSLFWEGGAEITVVSIQWSKFTNEEMVQSFRRWVKANRPKHLANPDSRGHKLQDWRASLTKLAVMRLLSHSTALGIVDTRQDSFPALWNTKQFCRPKWRDVTKWYDARRDARKTLHKLFPFPPKDELPLSWQRITPGK